MKILRTTTGVLYIYFLCMFLAMVGCRDKKVHPEQRERAAPQARGADKPREAITQFRSRVQQLTGMLDAKENDTRRLAYDLCKEATAPSTTNIYETLKGIYVQAAKSISFEIGNDARGGEMEHRRLDVRLRNLWQISQWAALTVLFHNPENMAGWDMLLDVILKEREAATIAEAAKSRLDINNQRQLVQYRRFEHFKKEMATEEEAQLRLIKYIYHSARHRLTPEQRADIVLHIKSVLGRLPAEMECDLPTNRQKCSK